MTISDLNHLDWQAFCYVANELSPAERDQFEEQLAVDQVAREAVARAVDLARILAVAECHEATAVEVFPAPVAQADRHWARRVAWMSLGAAASLLVAVLVSSLATNPETSELVASPVQEASGELASAWTESRAELPSVWQTEAASAEASSLEGLGSPGYLIAGSDDTVALASSEAPSWMTAALLAQAGDVADEAADVRMEN